MVPSNEAEEASRLIGEIRSEYNKTVPSLSKKNNYIQYILLILSAAILAFTNFLGIILLVPLSKIIQRLFKKKQK